MSEETTAEGAVPRAGRRARFAGWRRQRPFWGAVLTILSGVVLWFSGRLQLDSFEIQLGIEGMQSTLLPVALVALGTLVLTQPQYRVFYGVIALAISVYSLLGVNLGGFGVGMVLGVVGGILVVSWLPRRGGATGEDGDDAAAVAGTPDGTDAEAVAGSAAPSTADEETPVTGRRHAVAVAAVAVLAVGGVSGTAPAVAEAAPARVPAASGCWDPLGWLEWACGDDGDDGGGETATPAPSPSTGGEGDGDGPGADTGDEGPAESAGTPDPGTGGTGGGAGDAPGPAAGAAEPGPGEDAGDGRPDPGSGADDGAGDGAGRDAGDEDAASTPEQARKDVEEAARLQLGPCARITFGGQYDLTVSLPGDCGVREDANVFSLDGELETRDLQLPLTGINGVDVVNVPVTHDGPRRDALRISVDEVKVPGFWLKTYAHDGGTVTNADYVSMSGNAQMYISSIHANLPDGQDLVELGEKLVGGASLVEMLLALTDARIGLMGATSDEQVWSDFREQVWSD